jgi:hypothetical protein
VLDTSRAALARGVALHCGHSHRFCMQGYRRKKSTVARAASILDATDEVFLAASVRAMPSLCKPEGGRPLTLILMFMTHRGSIRRCTRRPSRCRRPPMHCSPAVARHVRDGLSRTRGVSRTTNRVVPLLFCLIYKTAVLPTFIEPLWSLVGISLSQQGIELSCFLLTISPCIGLTGGPADPKAGELPVPGGREPYSPPPVIHNVCMDSSGGPAHRSRALKR